jgi:hypothetical protein
VSNWRAIVRRENTRKNRRNGHVPGVRHFYVDIASLPYRPPCCFGVLTSVVPPKEAEVEVAERDLASELSELSETDAGETNTTRNGQRTKSKDYLLLGLQQHSLANHEDENTLSWDIVLFRYRWGFRTEYSPFNRLAFWRAAGTTWTLVGE